MIRFLQQDNRVVKALFVVIIAAASVSMVVYLIPGLTGQGAVSAGTYAVVYPHWYSKFFADGQTISQEKVSMQARQQLQQAKPRRHESGSRDCADAVCTIGPAEMAG